MDCAYRNAAKSLDACRANAGKDCGATKTSHKKGRAISGRASRSLGGGAPMLDADEARVRCIVLAPRARPGGPARGRSWARWDMQSGLHYDRRDGLCSIWMHHVS